MRAKRAWIGFRGVDRVDHAAVAQHRHPVADLHHLVQLVGDEDDRQPAIRQAAQQVQQLHGLLRREHGRRLVEDEQVRAVVHRLEDLDALLLAHGQVLDERVRVDLEAQLRAELTDALGHLVHVAQHRPRLVLAQDDVLRDGERGHEHEVLVHHADAVLDRVFGRVNRERLALVRDASPNRAGTCRRGCSSARSCPRRSRPAGSESRPAGHRRLTPLLATTLPNDLTMPSMSEHRPCWTAAELAVVMITSRCRARPAHAVRPARPRSATSTISVAT